VDAQGVTQAVRIPKITILVSHNTHEYTIKDLSPFTTYHVNVTAVPEGRNYRPPAKITVTTQMAAPQPMVKPDFFGVKKETPGVITVYLPQAGLPTQTEKKSPKNSRFESKKSPKNFRLKIPYNSPKNA
jgi:netrin-G3 ligand